MTRICPIFIASLLLLAAACQKESATVTLELTIQQTNTDGKTYNYLHGDHNIACWNPQGAGNDSLYVNGQTYRVNTPADDATSGYATIDGVVSNPDGYYVVYPAAWVDQSAQASTTLTIPQNETYTQQTIANKPYQIFTIPMADYAPSTQIEMHPYCGTLAIPIQGSGYVDYIQLTSAVPISGPATLALSDNAATLSMTGSSNANKIRRLVEINTALTATAQLFYLAIPAFSAQSCTLTIGWRSSEGDATTSYQHTFSSATITQGRVTTLSAISFNGSTAPSGYTQAPQDGSEYNPYYLDSDDWNLLTTQAASSKHFILTANLTATSTLPTFNGHLDGNNHTITLTAPLTNTLSGTIENLTTAGSITLTDGDMTGAIAQNASSGHVIHNCINNCSVTYSDNEADAKIGGIVGYAAQGTITNCINNAPIITTGGNTGGIVGYTSESIQDCVNNGTITINGSSSYNHRIGGIVGKAINDINNCHNTANITNNNSTSSTSSYIGGIVGVYDCDGTTRTLSNCSNQGNISSIGKSMIGGIAGHSRITSILNSFAYCDITATESGTSAAGIVADTRNSNQTNLIHIENCYYWGTITSTWNAGICRYNNGTITHCYAPLSIVLTNNYQQSDNTLLTTTTTLEGGTDLATTLNNNITLLSTLRARQWTTTNGIVTFL